VIADPDRRLGASLRLPTFDVADVTLYKRITLVVEGCAIAKVFYPVFPPDKNAADVVAWLRGRA
jgi:peroxiredoxin